MAKVVKKTTKDKLQESLAKLESNIAKTKEELGRLEEQAKEIKTQISEEELKELRDIMEETGVSYDQLLELISNQSKDA